MTSRREFLTHAAAIGGAMALGSQPSAVRAAAGSRKSSNAPTSRPLIHVADLYRPHDDPDDHWDLATIYALAYAGDLDLLGILADNPENLCFRYTRGQNPDVAAVAQLNYLTDLAVPMTTGTM